VTLVEISAVIDETPPWWDADRLLGGGPGRPDPAGEAEG
jgi:xylan 1,4-beta-xylosidase